MIRMWREPQQPPAPIEAGGTTYTQDADGLIEAAPEHVAALEAEGFRRVLIDNNGVTERDSSGVPVTED